ncbi:rod shape-determining protein MreC [bacterium]|nr:rod shape-determining protein MreC [bacterium]
MAIALSLVLMNSSEHKAADRFRDGLQAVISVVTAPVMLVPRTITVWNENKQLREEVIRLQGEADKWRDATLENQRLRKLLEFKQGTQYEYLATEVIARDPAPNLSALVLNKGEKDGVTTGLAAVTADGLAGVIFNTRKSASTVQLATDRSFAASARVERTRANGILRWHSGHILELDDVPKNLDVKEGDRIVTSGLGGVIPAGIPVGVVNYISKSSGQIFQNIRIKPFVKFASLEELFILVPIETDSMSVTVSEEQDQ